MIYIFILLFILSAQIFSQEIFFDESTMIRSTEGGYVNLKTFDSIMSTNAYTLKVVTNDDRSLKHLQILSKTEADYKFEKEQEAFKSQFTMKCPLFTVTLENGEKFSLAENKNKITFFHFWKSDIETSYKHINEINQLYSKFKDNEKVNFLSINFDKNLAKAEKENFKAKINAPLVFGINGEMDNFGFAVESIPRESLIPQYYIANKKGDKVFVSSQFRGVDLFEKIINKELEKPDVNE